MRNIWRTLRGMLRAYGVIAAPYGMWAFLFLNFRTSCGFLGPDLCSKNIETALKSLAILAIAISRALLWGPNLILSLREGRFVDDWLLFRDVAPIDQLLKAIGVL